MTVRVWKDVMKDDKRSQLLKLLDAADNRVLDDVIAYAEELTNPNRNINDFALAKVLNERATSIIRMVANVFHNGNSSTRDIDIQPVNKSYILIADELKRIYSHNQELTDISPSPIWQYFDIVEGFEWELSDHIYERQNDAGQHHNAQVNKLCIISGKNEPKYTPKIKKMVDDADKAIAEYKKEAKDLKNEDTDSDRYWLIPEYKLTYNLDGTILVNNVLKLKKAHAGSASDKLMEQATKQPEVLFKPELGQYSRNLSTTLSGMGFSETLRALFFPVVSKDKGILFRQNVTRATADTEHIDTAELDLQLKKLGAYTEIDTSTIPF